MNTESLSPEQQQILTASLREGESLLHAAPCGGTVTPPAVVKSSFWARLFGKKNAPAAPVAVSTSTFYAITSKRVILFSPGAQKEWFLMLGMIQKFEQKDNGYGDIVLDYDLTPSGERVLLGLLNIADAEKVHNLLASAIDAAYHASPWSV